MIHLLDVNVLIALIDPAHVSHDAAHGWFETVRASGWATCPIVENGVLRIVGNPAYRNSPGSPAATAIVLGGMRKSPGHEFWTDDISLLDPARADAAKLLTPGQVTDSYLLALAVSRGGHLATFDRRLSPAAVRGGRAALTVIGA